jgi:Rho-binding antiterminator
MYHFVVKLIFKNSQIVQGRAVQTAYNGNREECIVVETEQGNEEIALEQIASMEAITKNPHFEKIDFS